MNFALDEVLLRAFRRFWACGSFGGKKKKNNGNIIWIWGS